MPVNGSTRSAPVVDGNVVFFATGAGAVVARDVATGALKWGTTVEGPEEIQGNELLVANGVVIAEGLREVVGLDEATGNVRWRYKPPVDSIEASHAPGYLEATHPATDGSLVYVPAWGASVSALDAASGAVRWTWGMGRLPTDTAARPFRSGAVGARWSGDTLFVTLWHFEDSFGARTEVLLVVLDRSTGRELWRVTLPPAAPGGFEDARDAPVLAGSLVVVPTMNGWLRAYDRASAAAVWSFRSSDFVHVTASQPVEYQGVIYTDGGDERLYALRTSDGAVAWRAAIKGGATRDLLVTSSRVYVPYGSVLTALDRVTGALVRTIQVDAQTDLIETRPTALGDQIFVTRTTGDWSFTEP